MKEDINFKIRVLSCFFVFLIHFIILLNINYVMGKEIDIFSSFGGIMILALSWIPFFLMLVILYFYSILINRKKYEKAKKYIYTNVIFLIISLVAYINIRPILLYVHLKLVNVLLITFLFIGTIISIILNIKLNKSRFNFYNDIDMLRRVGTEMDKLPFCIHKKNIRFGTMLYIIPYIIQPTYLVYIIMMLLVSVIILPRTVNFKKDLDKCFKLHKSNTNTLILSFFISVILAIIIYPYSNFFSLVVAIFSDIMKYIILKRIAKYYYELLES